MTSAQNLTKQAVNRWLDFEVELWTSKLCCKHYTYHVIMWQIIWWPLLWELNVAGTILKNQKARVMPYDRTTLNRRRIWVVPVKNRGEHEIFADFLRTASYKNSYHLSNMNNHYSNIINSIRKRRYWNAGSW